MPPYSTRLMEHTLAMQITGAVLVLVAIMKNKDPIAMNKSIFGDVEGVEGGPAASMRMLIGGPSQVLEPSTSIAVSMSKMLRPLKQ